MRPTAVHKTDRLAELVCSNSFRGDKLDNAIGLLKDTAIASIIAAPELMLRAKDLASSSFLPMHLYVLAGLLYFAMSYPLSLMVGQLERRLSKHHR